MTTAQPFTVKFTGTIGGAAAIPYTGTYEITAPVTIERLAELLVSHVGPNEKRWLKSADLNKGILAALMLERHAAGAPGVQLDMGAIAFDAEPLAVA